ncbi:hypothetical protein CRG98_010467 [Punica granatum]|nr:hypothetical protein CRG98_010467 [Punica granatum]
MRCLDDVLEAFMETLDCEKPKPYRPGLKTSDSKQQRHNYDSDIDGYGKSDLGVSFMIPTASVGIRAEIHLNLNPANEAGHNHPLIEERRVFCRLDAFRNGSNQDEEGRTLIQRVVPRRLAFVRRVPYGFHFDDEDEDIGHHLISNSRGRRGYLYELNDYRPSRILIFNGSTSIEKFLEWISDVDEFFDYYSIPDHGSRLDQVYRLRGKASIWWEKGAERASSRWQGSDIHMEMHETVAEAQIPSFGV